MADWSKILGAIVDGAAGFAAGSKIGQWLEMSDEEAFASIAEFVQISPTEIVDIMDKNLLRLATFYSSPDVRIQLIKMYVVFKIAEFIKYDQFRGFPAL